MTRGQMSKLLVLIEEGWPGQMTEEAAALYVEMLADLDGPTAICAVKRLLLTSEYRPTIATVRKAVEREGFPPLPEAMQQARRLARYREQRRFANGSGYEPVPPVVHDAVMRACEGLALTTNRWERQFEVSYASITAGTATTYAELGA